MKLAMASDRLSEQLSPTEFENLFSEIMEEYGWETNLTPDSGDRGVDIVAKKEAPFSQRVLIQVKKYQNDNLIGSGDIQKYSGLKNRTGETVDAVVVATTSGFTNEAKKVANNRDIKLINGTEIRSYLSKLNISVEAEPTEANSTVTESGYREIESEYRKFSAQEIMDLPEATVAPDDTIYDSLSVMKETDLSPILVTRDGSPCGVIGISDIKARPENNIRDFPVGEVMYNSVATVDYDASILEVNAYLDHNEVVAVMADDEVAGVIRKEDIDYVLDGFG
jgi:predicted transcriptional regulator